MFVNVVYYVSMSLVCSDSSVFTLISVLVCVIHFSRMYIYICESPRANSRLGTISSLHYYYYYYYYCLFVSVHKMFWTGVILGSSFVRILSEDLGTSEVLA